MGRRSSTSRALPPAALHRLKAMPDSPAEQRGRHAYALLPWVLGLSIAGVVLGPALGAGSLLGLDLAATPTIPVPRGIWGLGPDLPRRVPLGVAVAWASTIVGGPVAAKLLFAACIAVAFVGAWRLASTTPPVCRVGAGLLYAVNPFILTRLGVGHWMLVAAMAILPWALPHLLRPGDDLARTLLWSAALGATGVNGGLLGAVVVGVGVLAERGRGVARTALVFLLAQLPWIVPGAIVLASRPALADASAFATRLGPWGPIGLVVGDGFWRQESQVGNLGGVGSGLVGLGLLGLAVLGSRELPVAWRGRAVGVGGIGFTMAIASALPGVSRLFDAFVDTPMGSALRDGQRMLALFLVWLAPSVAAGALTLSKGLRVVPARLIRSLPAIATLVLVAPALWGVRGALVPVRFPEGWFDARRAVERAPGTVLAVPWHQYLDLSFAKDRRIVNPVGDFFGGDVLWSSDPELGLPSQEQADPREPHAARVSEEVRRGVPQSDALARLGVRWVVLLREVDWRSYRSLAHDPGLERVIHSPSIELYRVRGWAGPFVGEGRETIPSQPVVAPLVWLKASGAVVWQRPAATGWLRGSAPAGRTELGLVALPAGGGWVWYWPAVAAVLAYAITISSVIIAATRLLRVRRREPVNTSIAMANGAERAQSCGPQ
jgi:hypothetical protein